jgi:hypothetical protein
MWRNGECPTCTRQKTPEAAGNSTAIPPDGQAGGTPATAGPGTDLNPAPSSPPWPRMAAAGNRPGSPKRFRTWDWIVLIGVVVVFVPLSFWGGSKHWAGETDLLPFFMLITGALVIVIESVRVASPPFGVFVGVLVPVVTFLPSFCLYHPGSDDRMGFKVSAIVGAFLGLAVSAITQVLRRQRQAAAGSSAPTAPGSEQGLAANGQPVPPGQEPAVRAPLAGIGGWLLLPAIGLILSIVIAPIVLIAELANTRSEHAAYSISALIVNALLYLFLIVATYRFFGKRADAPSTMIYLLITRTCAAAALLLLGLAVFGKENDLLVVSLVRNLFTQGLATAIWIPYFRMSKRVKATFVR